MLLNTDSLKTVCILFLDRESKIVSTQIRPQPYLPYLLSFPTASSISLFIVMQLPLFALKVL